MIFIIDLDGPILDVSDRYYKAYRDSLKAIGGRSLDKDRYWKLKRKKITDYEILRMTSSERLLGDFKNKRDNLIEKKTLLKLDFVWPELKQTYENLFKKNPATLVTLRTLPERLNWQLKYLGINSWFKLVLAQSSTSSSVGRWQTKINLINKSGILRNIHTRECIFIGDTETDILAGKNMGIRTLGVSFGIREKELLLPYKPNLVFDSPKGFSVYLKRRYLWNY